jgi:hypothetical protein
MTTVIASVFVGVLTYLGRTARGKQMSINVVVGIAGLALALAMIEQIDKELAKKFAILAVVGTLLAHWQVIVKASGLSNK